MQRIEGAFEPAGLQRGGEQPERPVLGRGSREPQLKHLHPTSALAPGHVTFQTYVLYLSATGDFNESAGRVEGPRPAGVDVCAVVIMEDPDEVRTLQLGATQAENQRRIGANGTQSRCGVTSLRRNDLFGDLLLHFSLPICTFPLGPRAQASESKHKHNNTQRVHITSCLHASSSLCRHAFL